MNSKIYAAVSLFVATTVTPAATVVWNGPAITNVANNWTTGGNWLGGVTPVAADDVKFFDGGAIPGTNSVNNTVDVSTNIASLQFGSTNGFHTTLISAGQTLSITGAGGLSVGTPGDVIGLRTNWATITGAGASLVINNAAANLVLNQGSTNAGNGSRAILDLSGLDNFTANVSRIGIGTVTLPNPGNANQREAGVLYLAKTNLITVNYAVPASVYLANSAATNGLEMANAGGANNSGVATLLYLGQTNSWFIDSLGVGRCKSTPGSAAASLLFNPAFPNSSAVFRGLGGSASRVTWWGVGDEANNGSTVQAAGGTNDFSGGTVDALVDTMCLGRDTTATQFTLASNVAVLTFDAGTIDANTLFLGNQVFGFTNRAPAAGFMNVKGTASLVVNSVLQLASTANTSQAATNTTGTLNISGGTVRANCILAGALGSSTLLVNGGSLIVTNTTGTNVVGTPGRPLTTLALTNATLWLAVSSNAVPTNIVATSLRLGGTSNTINLAALPTFATYPTQFALIKYSGAFSGSYNVALGSLPAGATGYLVNNTGNSSIDLTLTDGAAAVTGIYFQQQPTNAAAGAGITPAITVGATNSLGQPATNVVITLSLSSGTGPLNGTLTQVTGTNGLATFAGLNLTATGVKQLLATSGGLVATSASFTITAGSAATLTFTTQPNDVGVNKPITPPVVVQLLDTYGNNVASNGVAITMALTSGTGTLSGNTNLATDGTGKSTFTNLSLNLVGTKTLTANKSGLSSVASSSFQVTNALPAFPGAEGAGANTSGGRGGDVYYVTNLNDTGTGSLRTGISSATGARTIVFKVSGNIALNSTLTINKPNITVAGQTAPGDGICIQDESFNIAANNVIVRHMRTRLGTNNLAEADGMWINSGTNIIVDHLSASWSVDETLSATTDVANLTVQNCFITESLQNSIHVKGAHGYGGIISGASTTTYTYLRNLYAHHDSRNPRLGSDSQTGVLRLDFRNNVIYDWGFRAGYSGATNETTEMNYVGNYLIAGPATTYNFAFLSGGDTTTIYQSGNFIDTDKNGLVNGVNNGWGMFTGPMTQLASPLDVPDVNTDSAGTAYQRVLAQSGAMPWHRDAYDQRMARTVRKQTGQLVDFVCATNFAGDYITNSIGGTNYIGVNPWPILTAAAAPLDTDSDGMPDFWETALGLATNNAADRNTTNSLGYTRLEDYLNWLADPHTLCNRNGTADFDLRAANGGATNLTFVLANGTNGTVSLLGDGYTARFTATNNYTGLANFTYTGTEPANGLSFGPVNVGVLVTTTNALSTTPTNLTSLVTGGTLQLSWPSDHTGWRLETQTNTLAVGLRTNWFTVSGSAATNAVSLPIGTANGSVFFRLAYP